MENERLAAELNKVDQTSLMPVLTEKKKRHILRNFIGVPIIFFALVSTVWLTIPFLDDFPVYECESRWMISHVKQLKLKGLLEDEDVNMVDVTILGITSVQELPGKRKNFVSCMGIGYTNLGTYFLTWSLNELPDKSNWYLKVKRIDADTYILNKLGHQER